MTLWAEHHPVWLPFLVGLCTLIESLVVIGAITPAVALIFSLGLTAGTAGASLWLCLLGAYMGAVSGDLISFLLGRHFHTPLLRYPPFSTHPGWIDQGEKFFAKYGVIGLILGRFFGPLRAVLPFIAGFLEMPLYKFLVIDLLSGLAWSPLFLLPGYLVGANINTILPLHFINALSQLSIVDWMLISITLTAIIALIIYIKRYSSPQ